MSNIVCDSEGNAATKGGGKANNQRKDAREQDPDPKRQRTDNRRDAGNDNHGREQKKFCQAWNSARGCTRHEGQCPNKGRHACDYKTNGQLCNKTNHGRSTHDTTKGKQQRR